jgi:hypothetical protein
VKLGCGGGPSTTPQNVVPPLIRDWKYPLLWCAPLKQKTRATYHRRDNSSMADRPRYECGQNVPANRLFKSIFTACSLMFVTRSVCFPDL